jgi:hypothetical protein
MRSSGSFRSTGYSMWSTPERARRPIGRITLDAKLAGKRRTGNPFAPFDEAGAGDGLMANLHGHEAGNGGHSQGEPTGTAPVLDPTSGPAEPRPIPLEKIARPLTDSRTLRPSRQI